MSVEAIVCGRRTFPRVASKTRLDSRRAPEHGAKWRAYIVLSLGVHERRGRRMGRLSTPATALVVAVLMAAGGGAYALATSAGGTITVCVSHANGTLYEAKKCAKHDKKLSWNTQGREGIQGLHGAQGQQGAQGPQGARASRERKASRESKARRANRDLQAQRAAMAASRRAARRTRLRQRSAR